MHIFCLRPEVSVSEELKAKIMMLPLHFLPLRCFPVAAAGALCHLVVGTCFFYRGSSLQGSLVACA